MDLLVLTFAVGYLKPVRLKEGQIKRSLKESIYPDTFLGLTVDYVVAGLISFSIEGGWCLAITWLM